jgi:hypothetical protein
VEVGSVTEAVCAAVGFPDATIMTGILSLKTGTGAARKVEIDWLRIVGERV